MITHLEVPAHLNRNAANVSAAGHEHTGQVLIDLATQSVGLDSLVDTEVLDVGCGVRFTQALINRNIPIKSYTGLEVYKPIVDFLREQVQPYDERFRYFCWNARNELYNPGGVDLASQMALPFADKFDLIWLFSVFTHLDPSDSRALLVLLRQHVRNSGKLFFSAFIDDELDGFEDRVEDQPLLMAYYGRDFMQSLVHEAGWRVEAFRNQDPAKYIQHYLVCSPV